MADADRRYAARHGCQRVLSGPRSPAIGDLLEVMGRAPYQGRPDFYTGGPVEELEKRVAPLLGKPEALFFATGTMAQQVALRIWAQRSGNRAVATHPLSHLEVHEREAYVQLTGLRPLWLTREKRQPTAEEVRKLDEPFGTLCLELPLRDPGFLLPTFAELTELVEAGRARDAYVHFDGARLWESTFHLGHDLHTIAGLADSVYVSFYKTLGGISGAALAGPADFIAEARAWRHRYGGNVFQQWPAALTALSGLDNVLPRLEQWVGHAKVVAEALSELPGARINPNPPQTHQFQLWLPHPAEALDEAALQLAEQEKIWFAGGWQDLPPTGLAMAEVTVAEPALDWSAEDVLAAGRRLIALVSP